MRPARFFDWLHDFVPDWLGRLVAALVLLSVAGAVYRGVREARADLQRRNAETERANAEWLRKAGKK